LLQPSRLSASYSLPRSISCPGAVKKKKPSQSESHSSNKTSNPDKIQSLTVKRNEKSFTFNFSRAQEYLRHLDKLAAERAAQRRAGRELGEIGQTLSDSLRACNVLQLKNVKRSCNQLIEKHRRPPEEFECRENYILKILVSICIKNKRYQFEIRRGSLRRKTVYLNGPYLYAYWRDGRLVRKQYLKDGKGRNVPRRVKAAIKPFQSRERIEREMNEIIRGIQGEEKGSALVGNL
jgi:hypothetical protein